MTTGKLVAVVGLGGLGVYLLFIRRNPATGLAAIDELLAPRAPGYAGPTTGAGNTSADGPSTASSLGTAVMGAIGAGSAAVASLLGIGGTTAAAGAGAAAAATGGGAGVAGATAGGIGLAGTLAITGGIAGGVILTWAVWKKGLFRGGEEALLVNPDRDQFLAQPAIAGRPDGADGSAWTKTNAWKLAALLTEITGEPDGSHYWPPLMQADHIDEFVPAAQAIKRVLAGAGIYIEAP